MRLVNIHRRIMETTVATGDVRRLLAVIAVALCFFAVLILATIAFAGWSANETATQRERILVENALNRTIARTLDEQKSVAWWDDSIVNMREGAINFDFLDANFGYFLTETYSHDEVFILNAANAPIYSFRNGERLGPDVFEGRRSALAPIIAEARGVAQTELHERPDMFLQTQTNYRVLSGAVRAAAWSGHLIVVDGRPAVVAALTILPNVDMSLTPTTPKLLVSIRFIDAAFIADIGRSLLLPDLAISAASSHAHAQVSEPFVTDDGVLAGNLIWTTRQPGAPLLTFILPMAALGLIGAGLLFRGMFSSLKTASGELATREASARHDSRHDALSGLPNRLEFVERMNHFLSRSHESPKKAVAAYIDIDRFKDINDTLGHRAGDHLIKAVAARLSTVLGPNDLLARFGGDEFAILSTPIQSEDVSDLCGRIRDAFTAPFPLEGQDISVTVSIGLAIAPDDGREVDELMRHADIALYRAKAEGRNQAILFSIEMAREVEERRATELDLRVAMEADQLVLHYQPIVSCGSHRIVGLEALLRWNHPVRGHVGPSVFIPIAEETGLMPQLGEWILDQAMRDSARWPDLEIAVNLSPVQIRHIDLMSTLRRLIDKHKIDPSRFVMEITEGVLLDPSERSRQIVSEIRALGFKTSLDDFGTGYSSLAYLCNFHFDKIKIDRSFITGQANSGRARSIVQAVTTLGRGLGMSVIAEGVETEVDALVTKQLGCTEMQGYFFARPAPASEINAIIARHNEAPQREFREATQDGSAVHAFPMRNL
jgi:diguanylate cyclase (GGDEF)-like protein